MQAPAVRRRTFLTWLIGGLLAAIVAAVAGVIGIFLKAPSRLPFLRGGAVPLPKALAHLQDGDVLRVTAPAGRAFVMADGGGANAAGNIAHAAFVTHFCGKTEVFAETCSHLGCAVLWNQDRARFECPCHGSRYGLACQGQGKSEFAVDGSVLHGPAGFPLAHVRWQPDTSPDSIELEMTPPAH